MAQILVRNLDEEAVKRLKDRARRDGRSLQAEAKLILEREADIGKVDMETARRLADAIRSSFGGRKFSDSAELIREDRDR